MLLGGGDLNMLMHRRGFGGERNSLKMQEKSEVVPQNNIDLGGLV